jgi:DHA1 family bicyclomycin/chloramphenicol resistance-like MFS transporter
MNLRFLPFLLILSMVACCIEIDISVPGFPEMTRYFQVGEGAIQMTIAYNFLGFCLAGFFHGPLSECYGRRAVMVWGNTLLTVGAVGCVFANSMEWLLMSRFLQGMGASTSAVVSFAIAADVYKGEKAARFIGLMNAAITCLMSIAPVIGGFINKAVGWRGNYTAVSGISVVSWLLLAFFLPETKKTLEKFHPKKVLNDYRKLFSSFKFLSFSLVPSIFCSAYMAFIACAPFLYMETYGLSILEYALHQGSIVGSFSVMSLTAGKVIQKMGARQGIIRGTAVALSGLGALFALGTSSWASPYAVTLFMVIFALGFAVVYPIVFAASLEVFPEMKGTASSAIMGARSFICAAAVGFMGSVYNGTLFNVSLVMALIGVCGTLFILYVLKSAEFQEA